MVRIVFHIAGYARGSFGTMPAATLLLRSGSMEKGITHFSRIVLFVMSLVSRDACLDAERAAPGRSRGTREPRERTHGVPFFFEETAIRRSWRLPLRIPLARIWSAAEGPVRFLRPAKDRPSKTTCSSARATNPTALKIARTGTNESENRKRSAELARRSVVIKKRGR